MTDRKDVGNSKNAFVCLVRGGVDSDSYANLIERNRSLEVHYERFHECDNLIFHEGDISVDHQEFIQRSTSNCKFIAVPENCFSESHAERFLPYEDNWRIGYKHMCRFFSMLVYDLVKNYKYIWRVDDDCILHERIGDDPFDMLSRNGYVFGFVREKMDGHKLTRITLSGAVKEYVESELGGDATAFDLSVRNYYNNLHVTRVDFWHRQDVRDFLKFVDDSGGIYKYRWGDSTIQALALRVFAGEELLHKFADICYEHKSHNWKSF